MLDVTPYPARVQHMADEPSYGLLVRTATYNGVIRPSKAFKRFAPLGMGPATVSVDEVAAACKADPVALHWATPVLSPASAIVMGEVFDRRHFSARNKRWCPDCLREHAHHRVWWDLVPVTTCPFHGVDLMTRCECEAPLQTVVNFVDHCRKGHSLADLEAPQAPEDSLAVDRYIVQRLLGKKEQGQPHLDASTLEDIIDLADQLGRAVLAPAQKLNQSRKDGARRRFLAYGFSAFIDLEGKLADALDVISSREHVANRKWGLEKTYGGFYVQLVRLADSPLRTALLDAVTRHGSTKTFLKGGRVLERYGNGEDTVPLSEAAAMCGVTFQRFRRLAVELEMIPSEWGQGTPLRLDRKKVEELAVRLDGNKSLKQIAAELGLGEPAATSLVNSGLIEVIMTGGFGQKDFNKWIIHRDGATDLLARLDALVPTQLETGDHLAGIPRAAQYAHLTVLEVVNRLLDGKLKIRGLDTSAAGMCRHLLDKVELRAATLRERVPGISLSQAPQRMGMCLAAVVSFANAQLLKTTQYGSTRTISEDEIERFKREYATVPQLSKLSGLAPGQVPIILNRAGVLPVAERPTFAQILYERPRAMVALMASRE